MSSFEMSVRLKTAILLTTDRGHFIVNASLRLTSTYALLKALTSPLELRPLQFLRPSASPRDEQTEAAELGVIGMGRQKQRS
ncbi:hypothetical protein NDU88_000823 [Pleurodeles waltl]|uniref:Uncharacterized protein n=1 Tax=Pleurodeles waltl TaxID=8319 RepID=A0AAV7N985_PLEWA|nr:hypothetical protein NDU88_000823 [Pleurodeles waltl]